MKNAASILHIAEAGNGTREAKEEKGKKDKKATILPRQNSCVQGVFQRQKRTPARSGRGSSMLFLVAYLSFPFSKIGAHILP
ncbi:MAG: hypothetical protein IJG84_03965, partial [Kiritimatiellae bacterium]|nr:hypothetical protein [Kiritimatiellia bacterium]